MLGFFLGEIEKSELMHIIVLFSSDKSKVNGVL
jgi:hypothetical protein